MRPEFELRGPVLAGEKDAQLRKVTREFGAETDMRAEELGVGGELGAAQPRFEGPAHAAAGAVADGVGHLALFGGESV